MSLLEQYKSEKETRLTEVKERLRISEAEIANLSSEKVCMLS